VGRDSGTCRLRTIGRAVVVAAFHMGGRCSDTCPGAHVSLAVFALTQPGLPQACDLSITPTASLLYACPPFEMTTFATTARIALVALLLQLSCVRVRHILQRRRDGGDLALALAHSEALVRSLVCTDITPSALEPIEYILYTARVPAQLPRPPMARRPPQNTPVCAL
jgi:hypothetical protein